jgi:chitinase
MKSYIFAGYTVASSLPDITKAQAQKLTHLNIAFGVVENNLISIEKIRKYFRFIPRLREYNPNLNILLSTGGGDAFGHETATDSEHLDAFVESTMKVIREFDLDGIDCDWEFPGRTGNKDEKYQHTALLKAYREKLDEYALERGRKCWLTIAAAAGQWFLDVTEMEKIHHYLDFINVMTYDLRGWAQPAGHHTNLYEPIGAPIKFSTKEGVDLLKGIGVPAEKLVIGVAFYSRRWDGVKSQENFGLHQEAETIGDFGPDYTAIHHIYEKSERFVKHWDDVAKAPWLFDGYSFISYDDPMSISYKAQYVKQEGLGGIMYWQHGADKTGILFDAIYNNLCL